MARGEEQTWSGAAPGGARVPPGGRASAPVDAPGRGPEPARAHAPQLEPLRGEVTRVAAVPPSASQRLPATLDSTASRALPAQRSSPRDASQGRARRRALSLVLAALAVGTLGHVARRPARAAVAPAPLTLGPTPLALDGRTGEAPLPELVFTVHGPTRTLALLHLEAEGVARGALGVLLDGVPVGEVPADTAPGRRERTLRLAPERLTRGRPQRLTLVPRGAEAGSVRLYTAWLEPLALPAAPAPELLAEAHAALAYGVRLGRAAPVAPANLHDAWRALRTAWLLLEAHPAPPPRLLEDVRARETGARAALDARCAALLLGVEAALRRGDADGAHAAVERVEAHVPGGLHPCGARARALLAP